MVIVFGTISKVFSARTFVVFLTMSVTFGTVWGFVGKAPLTIPIDISLPLFKWENQFWNPINLEDCLWILFLSFLKIFLPGFGLLLNSFEKDEDAEASAAMMIWLFIFLFGVASSMAFIITSIQVFFHFYILECFIGKEG